MYTSLQKKGKKAIRRTKKELSDCDENWLVSRTNIDKQTIKISNNWMMDFWISTLQREEVNKVLVHLWPENKLSSDMV